MIKDKQFELQLGFIAKPISQQLKKQDISFDKSKVAFFDRISHSINFLKVHDFINESASKSARHKLYKQVQSHYNNYKP